MRFCFDSAPERSTVSCRRLTALPSAPARFVGGVSELPRRKKLLLARASPLNRPLRRSASWPPPPVSMKKPGSKTGRGAPGSSDMSSSRGRRHIARF